MSTPTARIVIDGTDITARLIDKSRNKILVSIRVTDEAGIKSDAVELTIDNREGFPAPPKDAVIEVWLGYEPAPVYMGKFRVDEWTKSGPPNILTVSAKAAELTKEIKGKKTRSWNDTTIGAIVQKIAGEHGLDHAIDPALAGRAVEHIDQQTESDLAFLSRLAKRNGALFKLADGKVLFVKKGSKTNPSGKTKPARTVRPVEVSSWSMTESERGEHKAVKCSWVDHKAGKRKTVTAGSGKPVHRDKRTYRTEAEAKAAAQAQLGDLKRGKRDGSLEMMGNPDFCAEMDVTLAGFDPDVDGTYSAKSVSHDFSASGYTMSVSLEAGQDSEADSTD